MSVREPAGFDVVVSRHLVAWIVFGFDEDQPGAGQQSGAAVRQVAKRGAPRTMRKVLPATVPMTTSNMTPPSAANVDQNENN